jgi:hypothetical protein
MSRPQRFPKVLRLVKLNHFCHDNVLRPAYSAGGGAVSFLAPHSPTKSIRNCSGRNRTTGACARALYRQSMTSSTYRFPCEHIVLAPSRHPPNPGDRSLSWIWSVLTLYECKGQATSKLFKTLRVAKSRGTISSRIREDCEDPGCRFAVETLLEQCCQTRGLGFPGAHNPRTF